MVKRCCGSFLLARRNRADMPFPGKMSREDRRAHNAWAAEALAERLGFRWLSGQEAERWRNAHPFAALLSGGGREVFCAEEGVSVVADGEDGIVACLPMGDTAAADMWRSAERALFEKHAPAVMEGRGYLTARPALAGGVQAIYVLHLPVLRSLKQLRIAGEDAKRAGCVLTPLGEEDGNDAALYALHGAAPPAHEGAGTAVREAAQKTAERERLLSLRMFFSDNTRLADEAWRALGTLLYARRLYDREWQSLWSKLRLGAVQGLYSLPLEKLDQLYGKALYPDYADGAEAEKQIERARLVRGFLEEEYHAHL